MSVMCLSVGRRILDFIFSKITKFRFFFCFSRRMNTEFYVGTSSHFCCYCCCRKLTWIIRRLETLSGVFACTNDTDNNRGINVSRIEDIMLFAIVVWNLCYDLDFWIVFMLRRIEFKMRTIWNTSSAF